MNLFRKWAITLGLIGLGFAAALIPFNLEAAQAKRSANKTPKQIVFPDFPKSGKWFNAPFLKRRKFFKNKITLVYFWDYTSINSIRELEIIKKWQAQYKPYGYQTLWVHAPEFKEASGPDLVQKAIDRFNIEDPVFSDPAFVIWEALEIKSWPTKILVNEKGEVVFRKTGEGEYFDTETKIRELLKQRDPAVVLPPALNPKNVETYEPSTCGGMSAETYLGNKRASWWGAKMGNNQYVDLNETKLFVDRGERTERGFFLEGAWTNREDYMEHSRDTDQLTDYAGMLYEAREVYAVLESSRRNPVRVYVTRDDMPLGLDYRGKDIRTDERQETYFEVSEPRLYYLIEKEDAQPHELKLWTADQGIRLYSFSFSNYCLSEFEHR